MDKEFFLNSGIPPPLPFETPPMLNWQSQSSDLLFESSWEKSMDHYSNFESALSSIVSSPAASNSTISQDNFVIHELIGKLTTARNSGEISPHSHPLLAATAAYIGNRSINSSPSKSVHYPITDHFGNEKLLNLGNSIPMNPNLVSSDPGFAERAAKFSCFGSRSFNDRGRQLPYRSGSVMGSGKLSRVSSSPLLNADGSPMGVLKNKNSALTHMEMRLTIDSDTSFKKICESSASGRTEFANSNEGSSVTEQIPSGDIGLKTPSDSNSRKRKAVSRAKSKEIYSNVAEAEDDLNAKRSKAREGNGSEKRSVKTEEETKTGDEGQKLANPKPPEPPKDYIHVRARRGQATDSHSLAERVRREKISERMKLLQDLVPNCNKVTGKALMLDEIINYVQSLQRQVEFLSMKLASVDFSMDNVLEIQPIGSLSHPTSASALFGHHTKETPKVHANFSNGAVTQCSIDPINTPICQNTSMQLTPIYEFGQGLPQFPTLCEDDLQSILQMGFGQNIEL